MNTGLLRPNKSKMPLTAQVLLYLMKVRMGLDFRFLAFLFNVSVFTAFKNFWRCVIIQNYMLEKENATPNLWSKDFVTEDEINSVFDDIKSKGQLRATILKSAETVFFIFFCYIGDAIRCALSADLKMVARPIV